MIEAGGVKNVCTKGHPFDGIYVPVVCKNVQYSVWLSMYRVV